MVLLLRMSIANVVTVLEHLNVSQECGKIVRLGALSGGRSDYLDFNFSSIVGQGVGTLKVNKN